MRKGSLELVLIPQIGRRRAERWAPGARLMTEEGLGSAWLTAGTAGRAAGMYTRAMSQHLPRERGRYHLQLDMEEHRQLSASPLERGNVSTHPA